ncbi:DUF2069 domain-containing protein [Litoribacillus peritrichatus]|uniref:DUF2069 domain-containing protein n=1 Tax=Litoribacillus peritrichatus TaxID=718191 RepID=A0ABP7N9B9_9GAMM
MTERYQTTLKIFWVLFVGLIALFGFDKLIRPETIERTHLILLTIQVLPLLAFLPMLRKPTARTFQWFCFALLLYFMIAVLNVFSPGMYYIGIIESVIVGLLFVAAMMLGRWKMRQKD